MFAWEAAAASGRSALARGPLPPEAAAYRLDFGRRVVR